MFQVLIYFFALFVTLPFIVTWLGYIIKYKWHKSKQKAVHAAANWSTIFYIISVNLLFSVVLKISFIGYTFIILLLILIAVLFIQWKLNTEVHLRKALKVMWRASFLLFFFLYFCFVLFGILIRIFS